MYRELSLEHSLYTINDRLLNEFKEYPRMYKEIEPLFNVTHSKLDTWAALLNNWLLFISDDERLIIDQGKAFSHSFNILCNTELEKSNGYLAVLARFNRRERFIVACFVTNNLHEWKREIMKDHNYEEVLEANLDNEHYFLMNNSDVATIKPISMQTLEHQSKMTKVLIRTIRTSTSFERCIQQGINEAQAFLRYK